MCGLVVMVIVTLVMMMMVVMVVVLLMRMLLLVTQVTIPVVVLFQRWVTLDAIPLRLAYEIFISAHILCVSVRVYKLVIRLKLWECIFFVFVLLSFIFLHKVFFIS